MYLKKRRKSWYEDPEEHFSQQEVEKCATDLHNLVTDQNLNLSALKSFLMAEPRSGLLSKASCELDKEGHNMCALHILVWNANFSPAI